jgi:hypothetical protein
MRRQSIFYVSLVLSWNRSAEVWEKDAMQFGHNSNLKVGTSTYHIQTEDRGEANPVIDTTVYIQGRVLYRRPTSYSDLLPLDAERERTLKQRLDQQHLTVMEELRSGKLQIDEPAKETPSVLVLELTNAGSWLSGRHAILEVAVSNAKGAKVPGAKITARIDGAAAPEEFSTQSDNAGHGHIEFDVPKITGPEPALVLNATLGAAKGALRFALRAKPRATPG